MSVICAVQKDGDTVMAADTLTLFGEDDVATPANAVAHKFMRLGTSLVGGAGWGLYDDILRDHLSETGPPDLSSERSIFRFFLDLWKALHDNYTFVNDQAASKDTPFGDLDSTFVIANPTGIFKVSSDLCVTRFEQYCAVGSGSQYACGAMQTLFARPGESAESIATAGVQTSIALNVHCGGSIDVAYVDDTAHPPQTINGTPGVLTEVADA